MVLHWGGLFFFPSENLQQSNALNTWTGKMKQRYQAIHGRNPRQPIIFCKRTLYAKV